MARPCNVCRHPSRHLIELGLVHGLSPLVLAKKFGIAHDSIYRHAKQHLTATARAAILTASEPSKVDLEQLRRSESEGLLASLLAQRARLQQIIELAMAAGDPAAATSAEKAMTASLALTARLCGQLINISEHRSVHLLASPDFVRLRGVLMTALRPHPAALADVAAALARIEGEAAGEILATAGKPAAPVLKLIEHAPAAPVAPTIEPPPY